MVFVTLCALEEGHEIANHGYSHLNVFDLQPQEFDRDIKKSTELLVSLTGIQPFGYRAPNFSFDHRTTWAYPILRKYGYTYSSSVFPFKTRLYGVRRVPLHPYRPSSDNICVSDPQGEILEFPATVGSILGKKIPISGGFYFRLLSFRLLKYMYARVGKLRPAMFYLHLRDINPKIPRLKDLSLTSRFFHYYGLKQALKKLELLLVSFEFQRVIDVLGLGSIPFRADKTS